MGGRSTNRVIRRLAPVRPPRWRSGGLGKGCGPHGPRAMIAPLCHQDMNGSPYRRGRAEGSRAGPRAGRGGRFSHSDLSPPPLAARAGSPWPSAAAAGGGRVGRPCSHPLPRTLPRTSGAGSVRGAGDGGDGRRPDRERLARGGVCGVQSKETRAVGCGDGGGRAATPPRSADRPRPGWLPEGRPPLRSSRAHALRAPPPPSPVRGCRRVRGGSPWAACPNGRLVARSEAPIRPAPATASSGRSDQPSGAATPPPPPGRGTAGGTPPRRDRGQQPPWAPEAEGAVRQVEARPPRGGP